MKTPAYIITGPTASGKSDMAHRLAQKIGGVIINCDSVQIYHGIENIAASPFAGRDITPDIDGVPYRLFSVLNLSEQISVAEYMEMARREYMTAMNDGHPAIFVGGTGYYINAIIHGISPMPEISDNTRRRARDMVATDIDAARKLLKPDFKFTDPQRISRALEILLETGKHISEFQAMPRTGAVCPDARRILVNPTPDTLRTRIAMRIPQMISGGAIDEGHRIIDSGWDTARAIGAAQICAYIRGNISMDECISEWTTKTNQYAKRQRTWFRTQFAADIEFCRTPTDTDIDAAIN